MEIPQLQLRFWKAKAETKNSKAKNSFTQAEDSEETEKCQKSKDPQKSEDSQNP